MVQGGDEHEDKVRKGGEKSRDELCPERLQDPSRGLGNTGGGLHRGHRRILAGMMMRFL